MISMMQYDMIKLRSMLNSSYSGVNYCTRVFKDFLFLFSIIALLRVTLIN
jgi:hypothetical protein